MASASQMGQVNILNAGVVREYAQGVSCLTLSEHGVTMVGLPCPRRKQASARVEIARVPDVREVAAAPGSTIMSNKRAWLAETCRNVSGKFTAAAVKSGSRLGERAAARTAVQGAEGLD